MEESSLDRRRRSQRERAAIRRARLVVAHQCVQCEEPLGEKETFQKCQGCRDIEQARRFKRVAKGICIDCGFEQDRESKEKKKQTCKGCRRKRKVASTRLRLHHEGRGCCKICGGSPLYRKSKRCKRCWKKESKSGKKKYRERKKVDLCVTCGGSKNGSQKVRCDVCDDANGMYKWKSKRLRKELGICLRCPAPVTVGPKGGFLFCDRCRRKGDRKRRKAYAVKRDANPALGQKGDVTGFLPAQRCAV